MTITFAVDSINKDLYIDNSGNLAIVEDLQAVLQICERVVKTRLGEISSQTDVGIPYLETIFIGTPNFASFEAAIKSRILRVPDVTGINRMSMQLNGDELIYDIEILTIYGNGVIGGTVV